MSVKRKRLPQRRPALTTKVRVGRFAYHVTFGAHPTSGALREVFVSSGKTGTDLDIASRDIAVAASLALQYGCPPGELAGAAARDEDGNAAGILAAAMDLAIKEGW